MSIQQQVPNATVMFPMPLSNGGSNPRIFDFDDHVIRIVKWQPSSHGQTASYSELAASRVGQLFEVPVIRGTLVHVEPGLTPPEARCQQPFHVGFTFVSGTNFRADDYAGIRNRGALPAAAVHLAWLRIGDHEGHNQFLWNTEQVLPDGTSRKMNHFLLVDQAALFGTHDWSSKSFGSADTPYALPQHLRAALTMDLVRPVLGVVGAITREAIVACFSGVPATWGLDASLAVDAADYLIDRRTHLETILAANWS